MNIYSKLQAARVDLQSKAIKKSGNNAFAGYSYMELGDFMPHINAIFKKHGLCSVVSFTTEASLTIFNSDAPEEHVVFYSPMSTASLKGCHEVQNLGAVQTYLRRYLYVMAMEIVEHDPLDSTTGKKEEEPKVFKHDTGLVKQINAAASLDDLMVIWKSIPVGIRKEYHDIFSAARERVGGNNA